MNGKRKGETLVAPGSYIRTVSIGGRPLRLYRSPLDGPDHPWASWADLMDLAEMDDDMRTHWWKEMSGEVPDMLYELPDGARLIAEPMVGGMFQAWVWMGARAC